MEDGTIFALRDIAPPRALCDSCNDLRRQTGRRRAYGALPMSFFTRTLMPAAALSLFASIATAQDKPGMPNSLQGSYAASLEQCAAGPTQVIFDQSVYWSRSQRPLFWKVRTHSVAPNGFILNLTDDECNKRAEEIIIVDDDTIAVGKNGPQLWRCPPRKEPKTIVDYRIGPFCDS